MIDPRSHLATIRHRLPRRARGTPPCGSHEFSAQAHVTTTGARRGVPLRELRAKLNEQTYTCAIKLQPGEKSCLSARTRAGRFRAPSRCCLRRRPLQHKPETSILCARRLIYTVNGSCAKHGQYAASPHFVETCSFKARTAIATSPRSRVACACNRATSSSLDTVSALSNLLAPRALLLLP